MRTINCIHMTHKSDFSPTLGQINRLFANLVVARSHNSYWMNRPRTRGLLNAVQCCVQRRSHAFHDGFVDQEICISNATQNVRRISNSSRSLIQPFNRRPNVPLYVFVHVDFRELYNYCVITGQTAAHTLTSIRPVKKKSWLQST